MATRDHGDGTVHDFRGTWPRLADDVFVAAGARIIGDVEIGAGSSIWFNCVLRGDANAIRIGRGANIQDGSVVHVSRKGQGTLIGDCVTVGHLALVHACELQDHSFVGLSAIVMDDCVIEPDGMLAAGAMLTPGKRIAAGELWAGRPARFTRMLSDQEIAGHRQTAAGYVTLAGLFRGG